MPGVAKYLIKNGATDGQARRVINRITNAIRRVNDPCMDNFRIGMPAAGDMNNYHEAKAAGCCGFYDEKIILSGNGLEVYFGFNYGH